MKILVTGGFGMLAQDVVRELTGRGWDVVAEDRDTLDILSPEQLTQRVQEVRPDAVVNCAAWTDVDGAESNEAGAFALNALGPQNLAFAANTVGARLVHISTDYVFDGQSEDPYQSTHPVSPSSAYGRTKAAGEWAVRLAQPDALVVRTAWLYGRGGKCFPKTLAAVLQKNNAAQVVNDQAGQPTWTGDVARVIGDLLESGAAGGVYHATSSGRTTWHGFTQQIARAVGVDPAVVEPVSSEAYRRPAPRPASSVLGHDSLIAAGVEPIEDWAQRFRVAAAEVLEKADH